MPVVTLEAGDYKVELSEAVLCDFMWRMDEGNEDLQHMLEHLAKKTHNTDFIENVVRRDMVTDDLICFLEKNKPEDLCLWKEIIDVEMVSKTVKERFLIELMSKSDSIAGKVTEDISCYENCNTMALYEWLCEHASEGTLCMLADGYRTPKNILGLLSAHENASVAKIAKVEIKRINNNR